MKIDPDEFFLSSDQLENFFQSQVALLDFFLKDNPDSIPPHIGMMVMDHNFQTTNIVCIVDTDFNDFEEKKKIMESLATKLFNDRMVPLAISLFSEAWMVTRGKECFRSLGRPSQDPDRQEAVLVMAKSWGKPGFSSFMTALISRDSEKAISIHDKTFVRNGDFESNILDLFLDKFFELGKDFIKEKKEDS